MWRKSSYSASGECAEMGGGSGVVRVRDSRDPGSPVLEFGPAAWADFTAGLSGSRLPDVCRCCCCVTRYCNCSCCCQR